MSDFESSKTYWITSTTLFSISSLVLIGLLLHLWKRFHDEKEMKTCKKIQISIVINILASLIVTISQTVHFEESSRNIAVSVRVIGALITYLSLAYFLMIKIIQTYKDTFLSVNKRLITCLFIIYSISLSFWLMTFLIVNRVSDWYPELQTTFSQQLLTISYIIYISIQYIYQWFILCLFNYKLYKFILLTMYNDRLLSHGMNNILKHAITKQTTLITIIILYLLFYNTIYIFYWQLDQHNNVFSMLYLIAIWFIYLIHPICLCLTLKSNTNNYDIWCKYCHRFFIFFCDKLTFKRHYKFSIQNDMESVLQLTVKDIFIENNTSTIDNQYQCITTETCEAINRLCELLKRYKSYDFQVECYLESEQYIFSNILDDFHHLLQKHDSEQDFSYIYNELDQNKKHTDHMNCTTYCRYYSRRRHQLQVGQDDEKQTKTESVDIDIDIDIDIHNLVIQAILDKIHSFYYHSYDTLLRIPLSNTNNRQIEETLQMIKNKNSDNNVHVATIVNKFSSNILNINDLNHDRNTSIYSFGKRFEYKDKNDDWFVSAKYKSLKDELLNNNIDGISANMTILIYDCEYNKCVQYMESYYVKSLSDRNKNKINKKKHDHESLVLSHILALLIYTNYDKYQNIWSCSYRRIPTNESNVSLKNRHSYFYYTSLYLRELIENFGQRLIDIKQHNKRFYHGVNKIVYLTRTRTQFNAPLSTSTQISVALNFSHHIGIILELKYSSSVYPLKAKCFDCAYLSDFVNEKEYLFIGGIPEMIITNIINVCNGEIYKQYLNALNIINCILDGTYSHNTYTQKYAQQYVDLCCLMLSYQLVCNDHKTHDVHAQFPQYIINLLNQYCIHLKNIMIFSDDLRYLGKLRDLLCTCNKKNEKRVFDFCILLKLFPNLEQIEYFYQSSKLKHKIHSIVSYVIANAYPIDNNLKYIIIHHKMTMLQTLLSKYENSKNWNLFQDDKKIILYKPNCKMNFNLLPFRFNQVNQASASKSLLSNLL